MILTSFSALTCPSVIISTHTTCSCGCAVMAPYPAVLVLTTAAQPFPTEHQQSFIACQWCHCLGSSWCCPPHHSGHRTMDLQHLPGLHTTTPNAAHSAIVQSRSVSNPSPLKAIPTRYHRLPASFAPLYHESNTQQPFFPLFFSSSTVPTCWVHICIIPSMQV